MILITCEHGGNRVPAAYASAFRAARRALASHRGYDEGALDVARRLARLLEARLFHATVSRLLVDLNRSLGHPRVFSEFSRTLDEGDRRALVERHYRPYRELVEAAIRAASDSGERVWHVSVHSFTPVWNGRPRNADLGLLYDPARPAERRCCGAWKRGLLSVYPQLRVRRNYPYLGRSDGFTSHLRTQLPDRRYAGIELEINTASLRAPWWPQLPEWLAESLAPAVEA